MIEEMTEQEYAERIAEQLQVFGGALAKLASEQSAARSSIEQRWLEDLRQYHGEYSAAESTRIAEAQGSKIFVNITRNKTNAAEARLQDMLFPTDDRNWGIKPTPVPELEMIEPGTMMSGPDGQPVDAGALADDIERRAKDKAWLMQQEIDDKLTEASYNAKSRDAIHDACQLGTGILKGPVVVGRVRKRWNTQSDGTSVVTISEALEPTVERVDPWNFYPDMSARTLDECEFILERRMMTKKQLREFAKLPGVLQGQLRELVKTENVGANIARDFMPELREITGVNSVGEGNKYEIWEYHGPIEKDKLLAVMESLDREEDRIPPEEFDELDDEVEGVVFFSGRHVLKVVVNGSETGDRPYSAFNWEKDESGIFGFGVPYLMRNTQRIMNAAWRMMMDNAGASVADTTVVNREIVEPADGKWGFAPKKVYWLRDKTRSVQEAFASFSQPNHQAELASIFMMGRQLADEETNLPLIAQGEQSSNVTKTAHGMSMLMNSANIVLRRAVKNWDDDVTRTLITRFYDWMMQFSGKSEIKGDYAIDARGSGALLVKEKQQENLMVLAGVSANNPEFAIRVDWDGLYREIVKSLEVPANTVMLSDAEVEQKRKHMAEQAKQQPEDPTAQIKMAELQMKQQELEFNAQLKQIGIQMEMEQFQARMMQERELKLADIAARENITLAQLQGRIQIEDTKDKTARDKAAADVALKRTEHQLRSLNKSMGYDSWG